MVNPRTDALSRSYLDLHLFGGHIVWQHLRLGGFTLGHGGGGEDLCTSLDPLGVFLKPIVLALAASITSGSPIETNVMASSRDICSIMDKISSLMSPLANLLTITSWLLYSSVVFLYFNLTTT